MPRHRSLLPLVMAAAVLLLVLSPLLHLAVRSLGEPEALTRAFGDRASWELLGRSVLLAALVALTSMPLGTLLAWLTVRGPGGRLFRAALTVAFCAALAVPSYVTAFGLIAATGATGLLGPWLPETFHVRDYPLLASWVVLTCCTVPYVLLSVRAALRRECACLEEAAMCLGGSRFTAFRRITLPRIRPAVLWGGMLAALYSVADFGAVSLLGYRTLTWGIYSRYDTAFGLDEARALSLMLAILAIGLIALMRLTRPEITASTSAPPNRPQPVRLGPWALPACAIALVPLFIGVALPIAASADWLMRSGGGIGLLHEMADPAATTAMLAVVAALLVALLAMPLASLHLGRQRRAGQVLTPLTLIGFGVPGIVIAIAAVGLALSADSWIESLLDLSMRNRLYQSHIVLLAAYAALFLPEAAGPLRSSAARIHPDQLDAASQMGAPSLGAWRRIVLPQLAPGLAAGAALVFITTAKELPATLILAPLNTRTLATALWGAMEEAYFAQAAAAAILLVGLAVIGVAAALLLEKHLGGGR